MLGFPLAPWDPLRVCKCRFICVYHRHVLVLFVLISQMIKEIQNSTYGKKIEILGSPLAPLTPLEVF